MSSIAEIAAKVEEIVRHSPEQRILGARLGLRIYDYGFDPLQHGKLKDFVPSYVPSVRKLEAHGGDWYYGLATTQSLSVGVTPNTGPSAPDPGSIPLLSQAIQSGGDVWKTYASPNSRFSLVGNKETGELSVVLPGQPIPGPLWIQIPSCSADAHREIAKAFVAEIGDSTKREILQTVVEQAGAGPASGFYQKIGAVNLTPEWNRFRRGKILEHLATALRANAIEFRGVASLVKPHLVRQFENLATPRPVTTTPTRTADIHRIAIGAVQRMSESELRGLNIPLGYVLDTIENR